MENRINKFKVVAICIAFLLCNTVFCQVKVKFKFESESANKDTIVKVKIFNSNGRNFDTTAFFDKEFAYIVNPSIEYRFDFFLNRKTYAVNRLGIPKKQLNDTSIAIKFMDTKNYIEEFKLDTIYYLKNKKEFDIKFYDYLCPLMADNVFNQVTIEYQYSKNQKTKITIKKCLRVSKLILKSCNYNENKINFIYTLKANNNSKDFLLITLGRKNMIK